MSWLFRKLAHFFYNQHGVKLPILVIKLPFRQQL